ncbi:MAG: hypothetical protein ACRD26_21895, partial [Vicinamibacterales bacterium]
MSEITATFAFVPWLRRGIAAAAVGGVTANGRLGVPVAVSFGADRNAAVTLQLFGPGEVTGLDARVVTRTFPARDVRDAEFNFFPMVEF